LQIEGRTNDEKPIAPPPICNPQSAISATPQPMRQASNWRATGVASADREARFHRGSDGECKKRNTMQDVRFAIVSGISNFTDIRRHQDLG
jgi:hypothetical protein